MNVSGTGFVFSVFESRICAGAFPGPLDGLGPWEQQWHGAWDLHLRYLILILQTTT